MHLIVCAGQARMGKDVTADYLQKVLNNQLKKDFWQRSSFASNVKRIFQETFKVTNDFIDEWKVKSAIPPGFDQEVRKSLQFIGDGFRKIKNSIWIDLLLGQNQPMVISDGRYVNELKATHNKGSFNILIVRPDFLNDDPNLSEAEIRVLIDWAITNLKYEDCFIDKTMYMPEGFQYIDYVLFNISDIENLYTKIEKIVPYINKHFGDL